MIMLASKGPTELSHFYQGRICPTEISCPKLLECLTEFPLRAEFLKEDNLMYVGNALSMLFEHSAQFYTLGYMRRNGSERGGLAEFYREFRMQDDPIKQEALRAKSKRFRARNRLRAT
ncbi:hypothetical protein [Arundinibacter roseus]|uniref:Uncharacterized protein n=1 Tax=Arundinibacter roseus TaxID=2070510 RepID=A0A4R4KDG6_9BACT|nr:hypothetical protein [Arundinibacter roseus]TDB64389.1 hypothetical protein EZE20_11950 [Arundinibacter roseus]